MWSGIPLDLRPGGRVAAWSVRILVAAGLAAMVLSWARASDSVQVSEQVDWASVALAGAAAVVLGLVASILIARQAIAVRLAGLALGGFTCPPYGTPAFTVADVAGPAPAGAAASNGAGAAEETLVAGARMARYHTPLCPLTVGKAVRPAARTDHEGAGLRPCGVCQP